MKDYDDLKPRKSMFILTVQWLAFGALVLLVTKFIIMPFFIVDKLVGREVQKFDAETSAQVYDNSRQYQQGTNRDLARYCREWREAQEGGKKAVASLIASTLDTYQGPLTPENEKCKMEIGL
jgi:hypothetical protein